MKRFVSNTGNETVQIFSRDQNESKIQRWMKRTMFFFKYICLVDTDSAQLLVSDLAISSFTFTIYCRDRGASSVVQRDTSIKVLAIKVSISSLPGRYVRVDFPAKFSWLGETVGGCCHSDCGKQWWAGEDLPCSLEQGWQHSWCSKKWKSTQ